MTYYVQFLELRSHQLEYNFLNSLQWSGYGSSQGDLSSWCKVLVYDFIETDEVGFCNPGRVMKNWMDWRLFP